MTRLIFNMDLLPATTITTIGITTTVSYLLDTTEKCNDETRPKKFTPQHVSSLIDEHRRSS